MVSILLMGQQLSELIPGEVRALEQASQDKDIRWIITNPKSAGEHLQDCLDCNPKFVLVPFDFATTKSIFLQALGEGFKHVVESAGKVFELHVADSGIEIDKTQPLNPDPVF